jgi:hypothetical protein
MCSVTERGALSYTPRLHLRRGIYAEAGLLDEAEIELQRHLEYRPYDKQAKELVKTIRFWRQQPLATP